MNIAIHGKSFSTHAIPKINAAFKKISDSGCAIFISDPFRKILQDCEICPSDFGLIDTETIKKCNIFMSFGGDGTLLESVCYVGSAEVPILGVNTGRLGFLANTGVEDLDSVLDKVLNNSFEVESRMLIRARSDGDIFNDTNFGLNEVAILKQDTSSMITVHTYLDDEYLNSYWADGLIISTPTGSTGYSLSCGGPIVNPHSNSFILTPVSPHNLNVRPIIVSDKSVIRLEVESRSDSYLVSLDSRSKSVSTDKVLTVCKENFDAKLVVTETHSFLNTLRKKLNWGFDIRN